MYQVLSIFVSIITLAIASSSTLFITGNNKNIATIKSKSEQMNNQILANNELTKAQIISMIKKINHNDANIIGQHKDINNKMKKVEYESKSRTENVDSRLRSFKNITNANVIGMTDTIKTNDEIIHKRADTLKKNLDDYKIFNKSELDTIRTNHDTLSSSHANLQADYGLFQSQTNQELKKNYDHSTGLYNKNLNLINDKIAGIFLNSKSLDKSSKDLIQQIGANTDLRIDSLTNAFKNADKNIQNDISAKDTSYKNTFVQKNDLNNEINRLYFDNSVNYNNLNTLIAQTDANKNTISTMKTDINDNEKKIKGIEENYLKTVDIPQRINQVMPSTDIYKEVEKNKKDINAIDSKINTNVESIKNNNDELKKMMEGISGGLSGKITLKDLNDRIMKNAERIEGNAAKNKLEILQSVNKDSEELKKKISTNDINIKSKLNNTKDDYTKAFNSFVSTDMIQNKLKSNNVNFKEIDATNAKLSGELVVNGVKFSDLVKKTYGTQANSKKTNTPLVASYEKDFKMGAYVEPNKPLKLKEGVHVNMDDANLSMRYGTMNLNGTNVKWANNASKLNFDDQGANFNNTTIKVNNFENIKDKNNKGLGSYVENKILDAQKSSSDVGSQINKHLNSSHVYPKAMTTPYLFIGSDLSGKMNVKDEINKLKNDAAAFSKTSGIQQNATFYNKSNKEDLFKDIKNDMNLKIDEYLPKNIEVDRVDSSSVIADQIILKGSSLGTIKMNGTQPITDFLDDRYEMRGSASKALGELSKNKPIVDIQLTGNNVIQVNRSDGRGWINMGQVKVEGNGGISKIALDDANNRLIVTTTDGVSYVDLPNYSYKIKNSLNMDQYPKKSELENTYAKKNKNGEGVVYLNSKQQQRLNNIVDDDDIKNLKQLKIPTSTELASVRSSIEKNKTDINDLKLANKTIDGQIIGKVNTKNLNEQSRLNPITTDNFLRLNNNVSLMADGKRLRMCTSFDIMNRPTDCYDFWTTKDLATSKSIEIKRD